MALSDETKKWLLLAGLIILFAAVITLIVIAPDSSTKSRYSNITELGFIPKLWYKPDETNFDRTKYFRRLRKDNYPEFVKLWHSDPKKLFGPNSPTSY